MNDQESMMHSYRIYEDFLAKRGKPERNRLRSIIFHLTPQERIQHFSFWGFSNIEAWFMLDNVEIYEQKNAVLLREGDVLYDCGHSTWYVPTRSPLVMLFTKQITPVLSGSILAVPLDKDVSIVKRFIHDKSQEDLKNSFSIVNKHTPLRLKPRNVQQS